MSPRLSDLFLSSQSDERLVSLARAGHERAFAAIVERYRPELLALARRLCPDGRAEDVIQQAFLSAFAALRSGAEVQHLRGWLYRIARNAAARSRAPVSVPLDGTTASAETVEDIVQQRAVAMTALTELAQLPTRQRQAMVDTALGGVPRAEVASTMGLSEGAVRQLVHRARAALRTAVTAVTPLPMARWFAAIHPDVPGPAELTAGAGAASTGSVAVKLGALLASGTLVTGVAAVDLHRQNAHHPGVRSGVTVHARANAGGARAGTVVWAARAPAEPLVGAAAPQTGRVALSTSRSAAPSSTSAVRIGGARHEAGSVGSARRHEGQSGHREGTGGPGQGSTRRGGEGSQSSPGLNSIGGGDGGIASSASGRGFGGGGHESGRSGRGSGEPSGSIASASGPGNAHADQTVSASHHLDSTVERAGSGGFGGGSGSGGSGGGSGSGGSDGGSGGSASGDSGGGFGGGPGGGSGAGSGSGSGGDAGGRSTSGAGGATSGG